MANPNAPHGMNPVAYTNGAPWTGKANVYHIQSTDTLAYYIGDILQLTPTAGSNGATQGSDALGVPNACGFTIGTPVAAGTTCIGPIVGIQVAPVGTGSAGAQGTAVNLNLTYIPGAKLNDYYVYVADDPNLVFEIQADTALGALTQATTVNENATFTPKAPLTVAGPMSGTTVTSITTTINLPLKVIAVPYRVNITPFGVNCPLLVRFNTHVFTSATGTTGV